MSRDPYRSSGGDPGRPERWDRDRFTYERDRYDDERERIEEHDRIYTRERERERDRDRDRDRPQPSPRFRGGTYEDDVVIRERERRIYRDDEPRYQPRRSPPPEREVDRRIVIEKEREYRDPSPPPPRRPMQLLRRQSSLDTFDRRPAARYYEREREREEYPPPARREDYRPSTYQTAPLPRYKALPPPRRYAEREYYDEIKVSEPEFYGDEEFRTYPERVREREVVRTRERQRSPEARTARTRSHRGGSSVRSSSKTSTTTSRSSSSGGTAVKSEYPKKGKTRIPARLVSKRALMDLNYPFEEEGNTIVVQKALGQDNIDDLLKLSEDYKKADLEVRAARSQAGDIIEERRTTEVFVAPTTAAPPTVLAQLPAPAPPPAPVWATTTTTTTAAPAVAAAHGGTGPIIIDASPAPVQELVKTTIIRDPSPVRSISSSRTPVILEARPREISDEMPVGPLALVTAGRRPRSHSVDTRDIRAEIRDLERTLAHRERHERHERRFDRDLVKAERLPSGEMILYEERVEKVEAPSRGVRIEKDKKGRMSINVPKYR